MFTICLLLGDFAQRGTKGLCCARYVPERANSALVGAEHRGSTFSSMSLRLTCKEIFGMLECMLCPCCQSLFVAVH